MNLKWNEFQTSTSQAFQSLENDENFTDVTLACGGGSQIKAHKVILSSCSQFFKNILVQNPHQHPLIYLNNVAIEDLRSLMKFIYSGQVEVAGDNLPVFLKTADELQVEGLLQNMVAKESKSNARENVVEVEDDEEECEVERDEPEVSSPTPQPYEMFEVKQESGSEAGGSQEEEKGKSKWWMQENDIDTEPVYKTENELDDDIEAKLDALTEKRDGMWRCIECGKTDKQKFHLRRHAEIHLEGISHKCPACEKTFKTRANVKQHFNLQHTAKKDTSIYGSEKNVGWRGLEGDASPPFIPGLNSSPPKSFPCETCGHTAPTKNALRVHKYRKHRTHNP